MTDIDELSRVLGRLEESILQLRAEAELGRAQRTEMIGRLANIEGVSGRVSELERRQGSTERAVAVHEKWRQQGIGVFKFLHVVSGIVGAGLVLAVQYLTGHK